MRFRTADCSKTVFVKIVLIFLAGLFTFVLIHPDLDLLDVHDVKIVSFRAQLRAIEARLTQPTPQLFSPVPRRTPFFLDFLSSVQFPASSNDLSLTATLRI
jgi:hypothetical protein